MKITGAHQQLSFVSPSSNDFVPDQCSSLSQTAAPVEDVLPTPVSPPTKRNECLEDIQRLTDEELEFDEFLLDAAEWL